MPEEVELSGQGRLRGTREGDLIVYRGVRYAQAPFGENRFATAPSQSLRGLERGMRTSSLPHRRKRRAFLDPTCTEAATALR